MTGIHPNSDLSVGTARAFKMNDGESQRRITKFDNYFPIYDSCTRHLVGTDASLIEIGVQHGGVPRYVAKPPRTQCADHGSRHQ